MGVVEGVKFSGGHKKVWGRGLARMKAEILTGFTGFTGSTGCESEENLRHDLSLFIL
jgi:hypothetical protein